jgi:hypothetical protein
MSTLEKHDCDAKTQKQTKCTFGATIFRKRENGQHWCTRHGKAVKGEKEIAPDSPVTKEGPYFLSKLAQPIGKSAPVVKKVEEKKVEKKHEEEHEHEHVHEEQENHKESSEGCVKPSKKDTGNTCKALTANKVLCGKKAFFSPPSGCNHTIGDVCGTHWNSLHKGQKSASTRKEVADEDKCQCSKGKTDDMCGRAAFGDNSKGVKACWQHGGPKKSEVSGSSAQKVVSTAPSGPLAGANILELMFLIRQFEQDHKDCEECEEDFNCGSKQSVEWLLDLLARFRPGGDSSTESVMETVRLVGVTNDGNDFAAAFVASKVGHLKDILGQENISWLTTLIDRMARQPGEAGAEIEEEWKKIAEEQGIKIEKPEETPKGSSEKDGAKLSSRKTTVGTLEKSLQKAKERKAAKEAEEKAAKSQEKPQKHEEEGSFGVEEVEIDIE